MIRTELLEPVHREEDGELVGYLTSGRRDDAAGWVACALFGSPLRAFDDRGSAAAFLRRRGLALLAERWAYHPADGSEELVAFLVEARLGEVTVRFGHDPSTTVTLTGADLGRLVPGRPV